MPCASFLALLGKPAVFALRLAGPDSGAAQACARAPWTAGTNNCRRSAGPHGERGPRPAVSVRKRCRPACDHRAAGGRSQRTRTGAPAAGWGAAAVAAHPPGIAGRPLARSGAPGTGRRGARAGPYGSRSRADDGAETGDGAGLDVRPGRTGPGGVRAPATAGGGGRGALGPFRTALCRRRVPGPAAVVPLRGGYGRRRPEGARHPRTRASAARLRKRPGRRRRSWPPCRGRGSAAGPFRRARGEPLPRGGCRDGG